MGELLTHDPKRFLGDAVEILRSDAGTPGHAYLLNLLIENDLLPEALASNAKFTLEEAVEFVKTALRIDPLVDVKLARWILSRLRTQPLEQASPTARRILNILEHASSGARLAPMLVQLLRVPDPKIRSKVALLMGRGTHELRWALGEADPRVRANAVEAVWGVDSKDTRRTLWELARDPNNRVVGNALLGLYRLSEAAAGEALEKMSEHDSPKFRATAAWVMGRTGNSRFLDALHRMEGDPEENVRRNAAQALARINAAATPELAACP